MSDKINPELRSWLDNVLIPALVKDYMNELRGKNPVASPDESVAKSPDERMATSERDK